MASSYWSPFWYAGKSSARGAVNKLRYLESDGLLLSFSRRESLPSPHNDYQVAPGSRLPWSITVHFSEFPAEILLECPSRCLPSNSLLPTKHLFVLQAKTFAGRRWSQYLCPLSRSPTSWKQVERCAMHCETLPKTHQKPGDEADAGKRTQPTLVRALQVGQDF